MVNAANRYVCPARRPGPVPDGGFRRLRSKVCGVVEPSVTKSATTTPARAGYIGASGSSVPTTRTSAPDVAGGVTVSVTADGAGVAVMVAAGSVKSTDVSDGAVASKPPSSYVAASDGLLIPTRLPSARTV